MWQSCSYCAAATFEVSVIEERAGRAYTRVRSTDELCYTQLRDKLRAVEAKFNKLKLQNVEIKRQHKRASARTKLYKEIHDFLSITTIPGLSRFFPLASKEGWGIKKLFRKLKDAAAGIYHIRSYTKADIDLAILCYELGGAGAVFALNHSHVALPSLSTIQPYRRLHSITPCTHGIKLTDVMDNVDSIFANIPAAAGEVGNNLMFDEVATTPKVDWVPETDEMIGFCMEDVRVLSTVKVGRDTRNVEAAVGLVKEEKVHIGREATVGAITRLDSTNYSAKPILVAGTCKHGSWKEHINKILTTLEGWNRAPSGRKKHGPVYNICTDADAARRAALFVVCMCCKIDEKHPLWKKLKELIERGLNPRIGKDSLTMDIDYKHLFKRLCTLIYSLQGMVVHDVCINKTLLTDWLERIPGYDWGRSSVYALLNPDDGQDVPRALRLLTAVSFIVTINKTHLDPTEERAYRALALLGITFKYVLLPFITPGMSLSEQITSLVTFVHLLCALYVQNGRSFISNQLYGDLQTTVKAAILTIAKTQLASPQSKVYICLLGTDTLETLFGRARMMLAHNPNFNVLELRYILQPAIILDQIFEENPNWDRKPRRLQLKSAEDLDRLRPDEWRGEISANSCDLAASWKAGVKKAEDVLQNYGVHMEMSFGERFSRPNTDLLRPLGYTNGGKYPAISSEVDRSMVNSSPSSSVAGTTTSTATPLEQPGDISNLDSANNNLLNIDFDTMMANELAQRVASAEPHSVKAVVNKNGDEAFKKTIVNVYFDMTHDVHGSHERVLRVRQFRTAGKEWASALAETSLVGDQDPSHFFKLGSLFATLISPDGQRLALAVVHSTVLKKEGSSGKSDVLRSAPLAEIVLADSRYRLMGQVLSLRPIAQNGSEWAWDTDFVRFTSTKPRKNNNESSTTQVARADEAPAQAKDISFIAHGALIHPLKELDYRVITPDEFPEGTLGPEFHQDTTWAFSSIQLRECWSKLWEIVHSNPQLHEHIPVFTGVHSSPFPYYVPPYQVNGHTYSPIWWSAPVPNTVRLKSDTKPCHVCYAEIKDGFRQQHMGQHILKRMYAIKDRVVVNKVNREVINEVTPRMIVCYLV
ncbi:hypothetical protein PQX77_001450 [Marasmius sp. AFHP31]|nr:hypothetical protein PQX77_001450 [Marasmius sp. AFHP31]